MYRLTWTLTGETQNLRDRQDLVDYMTECNRECFPGEECRLSGECLLNVRGDVLATIVATPSEPTIFVEPSKRFGMKTVQYVPVRLSRSYTRISGEHAISGDINLWSKSPCKVGDDASEEAASKEVLGKLRKYVYGDILEICRDLRDMLRGDESHTDQLVTITEDVLRLVDAIENAASLKVVEGLYPEA